MKSAAKTRLLTPDEVCQLLSVSNQTLTNWRYRSTGNRIIGPPWVKISGEIGRPGGEIRYREDDLELFIASRRVK